MPPVNAFGADHSRRLVELLITAVVLSWFSPSRAAAPGNFGDYADAIARQAQARAEAPAVVRRFHVAITAYASTPEQTDRTPCITASGYDVCAANREDVVAANFLRFGTKLRLPEYSGERIYTVQDRMHQRYPRRLDLWKRSTDDAKVFGARYLLVEVVEY